MEKTSEFVFVVYAQSKLVSSRSELEIMLFSGVGLIASTQQKNGGIHLTIKVVDEKYLINVDFPTESIVHLNPLIHPTGSRCQTGMKIPSDGGILLATEDEVRTYLNGSATLLFDDKKVGILRKCKLCMQGEVGEN